MIRKILLQKTPCPWWDIDYCDQQQHPRKTKKNQSLKQQKPTQLNPPPTYYSQNSVLFEEERSKNTHQIIRPQIILPKFHVCIVLLGFCKKTENLFFLKNLFKNPSQHRFCAPSIVNLAQPLAAITYNHQAAAEAEEKFWLTSKTFLKNALQRNGQMDRAHHLYRDESVFSKICLWSQNIKKH